MTNQDFNTRAEALRYNETLAASQPGLRARNLAQALGVSEAVDRRGLWRPRCTAPADIFRELGTLGEA